MRRGYKRHSDEDVKFWAEVFVELGYTLEEIENQLGISHSTVWWCFLHRLPYIDNSLYESAVIMLDNHKHFKKKI